MPFDSFATRRVLTLTGWRDVPVTSKAADPGFELRQALGLPEPNYGPQYRNPAYFGGYRNREDWEDAMAEEARWRANGWDGRD